MDTVIAAMTTEWRAEHLVLWRAPTRISSVMRYSPRISIGEGGTVSPTSMPPRGRRRPRFVWRRPETRSVFHQFRRRIQDGGRRFAFQPYDTMTLVSEDDEHA